MEYFVLGAGFLIANMVDEVEGGVWKEIGKVIVTVTASDALEYADDGYEYVKEPLHEIYEENMNSDTPTSRMNEGFRTTYHMQQDMRNEEY